MQEKFDEYSQLEAYAGKIFEALLQNPECKGGLTFLQDVIFSGKGPSGGPEILAVIHDNSALDSYGYWYGHVLLDPADTTRCLMYLYQCSMLFNASDTFVLLSRYHSWLQVDIEPAEDAAVFVVPLENGNFRNGAEQLAKLIREFSPDKHWPNAYKALSPGFNIIARPAVLAPDLKEAASTDIWASETQFISHCNVDEWRSATATGNVQASSYRQQLLSSALGKHQEGSDDV